jgi:excinuclease ABC subunit A
VIESDPPRLSLAGMRCHNLDNLAVEIPLQRLVCLTGVSGSGKTTLARDILLPALQERLQLAETAPVSEANGESDSDTDVPESSSTSTLTLRGADKLRGVILIDQAALGKTPRSNPAVYIGAFDHIRDLFAHTDLARQRGLNSSAFSFNSGQGQCERCRGAGFEKIEMQFLSDVFIRCAECNGRRYRPHILEIKLAGSFSRPGAVSEEIRVEWSIADLLEATVDDALLLLISYYHLPAGRRALEGLKLLQEVGLGYLRLGQPVTTLSGGECQRLKLVKHLAEFAASERAQFKPTLLIFDEPTTGLHFEDVRILLQVFQRIVDAGHSLLVIEHNLDVIRAADWVIDLGPEGGAAGGQLVAQGTPEIIAACQASHTGAALRSGDPKLYAPLASRRKPRKAIGCPS